MIRVRWRRLVSALAGAGVACLTLSSGLNESPRKVEKRNARPSHVQLVQQPANAQEKHYRFDANMMGTGSHQRGHSTVLRAFSQVTGEVWSSTVQIMLGARQLALGTIVDSEGWIATKASEMSSEPMQCVLSDGTRMDISVRSVRHDLDLAILKALPSDGYSFVPVQWHPENNVKVGGWIATLQNEKTPLSIGVVSVRPRAVKPERAILGIDLDAERSTATIKAVLPGGGAAKAGMRSGDEIVSIDETQLPNREAVLSKIATLRAGQRVSIGISRAEDTFSLEAQLMDIHPSMLEQTEVEVNGNVSARSAGFDRVFQHDTVLEPYQCGGPVLDTRGRVVGINIARAGRVSSYALPLDVVVPAIRSMVASAKAIPVSSN